ncbi:hypothetical protein BP00DRAFT_88935 [Aspergillus indologenus CBS 114.80]|uniref:Uncharacterized protein n=1 Tax=Aspergillus indologenus CBS 114.80 TaxID=1450541 RepID=A0A2V5ICY5_9EURO|nr:hypothetical protein BP00DRAFT_88935 [Aspergillus indologenus CBS 114.80]
MGQRHRQRSLHSSTRTGLHTLASIAPTGVENPNPLNLHFTLCVLYSVECLTSEYSTHTEQLPTSEKSPCHGVHPEQALPPTSSSETNPLDIPPTGTYCSNLCGYLHGRYCTAQYIHTSTLPRISLQLLHNTFWQAKQGDLRLRSHKRLSKRLHEHVVWPAPSPSPSHRGTLPAQPRSNRLAAFSME